jgi:type VI secretion system protein ImpM
VRDVHRMLTPPAVAPGYFGKVPGRGDFISRRVPGSLRADWEAWLATLVVAARESLGPSWPDDWLTAPLWHFGIGAEFSPPHGAAGVLVASADRVGRCFPFSLIAAASGVPDANAEGRNGWARGAEELVLRALEDDFDPDVLDAALIALGPPAGQTGPSSYPVGHWRLTLDGDWPRQAGAESEVAAPQALGGDQSVWYSRGSARVPSMHIRCTGLPNRAIATAMITGDFDFASCIGR